jgi:hypothetical protein
MRNALALLQITIVFAATAFGQLYQGPASGSIAGGVMVNTDDFADVPPGTPEPFRMIPNRPGPQLVQPPPDQAPPLRPETYNAFEYDPLDADPVGPPPIELGSFQGIPDNNSSFPPDPHAAAGPNHIISCVNTRFRISDKAGNTLKTITASTWFGSTLSGAGPFDPQIMYDRHHDRWIMLWDHLDLGSSTAYFLISVSDDDDPLGVWYNWALPAHVNGSTASGTWGDYPQMGYDGEAIYIVSREFSFATGFWVGPKLRIVGTDQLFQNDAGPVTWTDLWSISYPGQGLHDGLRPSIVFTDPDEYYLIASTTYGGTNSSFALYRLTNPLTAPVMTAVNIPVAAWTPAPQATQLGGGVLIETGGSSVPHAAVYRDSSIWMAHSVSNGAFSSIRYLRIDTETNTPLEDARLGATGYYHYYPALMVDADENVAITFSRSGASEYIGAGMMWRLATDSAGLQPALIFKEGETNYQRIGDGRNRWGDYMGIALDPTNTREFWMFTEYAASPANTWGTWWYHVRLLPYDDQKVFASPAGHDFGKLEVGTTPDTLDISVFNVGTPDLNISAISVSLPDYTLIDLPSLPVTISTFDSVAFKLVFDPVDHGDAIDSIVITSDDPSAPSFAIHLEGRGVIIGAAQAGTMYATSGPGDEQLYTIDEATGDATVVGPTGVTEFQGLAIRPSNNELFGAATNITETTLYRIAAAHGDALPYTTVNVANMRAIAFSEDGTLYGGTTAGHLYSIDPETGVATLIGQATGIAYSGLSVSPTSGMLWGSVRGVIGRDRIYTVNTSNGDTTLIGRTGDNMDTPYIAFLPTGVLYGLKGAGAQENTIIAIDTLTGVGTLVGATGATGLTTIAMRMDPATSVEAPGDEGIPTVYSLAQNYPNPFNPSTEISFGLPERSEVRVVVYNLLGQAVRTLVDRSLPAGVHSAGWDGRNAAGNQMASGLYFYQLEARGGSAAPFTAVKKMLLLR